MRILALGWCVVLLMRYLGIVWGPGYPREQVGALRPPKCFKGVVGAQFQRLHFSFSRLTVGFIVIPRCEMRESEMQCFLDTRALKQASHQSKTLTLGRSRATQRVTGAVGTRGRPGCAGGGGCDEGRARRRVRGGLPRAQ